MTATRTVAGVDLPAAGVWTVDPAHVEVGFVGRHFGLTRVRGRFTGVEGTIVVTDDPARSSVEVVIDMTSVRSGDRSRDDHLRSGDFFDVEHHPTATFRSTRIDLAGPTATMTGDLTIKDVSRPVVLAVSYAGHVADPWGNDRAVFSARGTIDREDWGLTWNVVLEAGGLLVSKQITLEIEVELVRAAG
jgi:polyisoprenoid-binding protein YceI